MKKTEKNKVQNLKFEKLQVTKLGTDAQSIIIGGHLKNDRTGLGGGGNGTKTSSGC